MVLPRLFAGLQRGGCVFHAVLARDSAGVDFRGGTLVYVKFAQPPDDNAIRAAMDRAGLHNARIQSYGSPGSNEVLIDVSEQETSEQALDRSKTQIINALESNAPADKQDLNNTSSLTIKNYLMQKDPLRLGTDAEQRYTAQAQAIVDYRDKMKGGVLHSLDELKAAADPAVVASLPDGFFLSDFRCPQRGNRRTAGGSAVAQAGLAGHGLFTCRHADLPGLPL